MDLNCRLHYRISLHKSFYTVLSVGIIAVVLLSCIPAAAQSQPDSLLTDTIYFRHSSAHIDKELGSNAVKIDLIRRYLSEIGSRDSIGIDIFGYASPEGPHQFNEHLARQRAEALQSAIKPFTDIIPSIKWGVSPTAPRIEWPGLRYAAISVWRQSRQQGGSPGLLTEADASAAFPAETAASDSAAALLNRQESAGHLSAGQSDTGAGNSGMQEIDKAGSSRWIKFFIGTNLLYDAALTPNISAGIYLGNRVTVYADWMYAWWSKRDRRRYWRVYGGDIEARVQLGGGRSLSPFAGHHIGIYASIVTYDFQFGWDHIGVIGDKYNYAAGISYGYTLPVTRRLNIDFSIGVGYMWGRYMKHTPIDDHDVWISTHNRRWFGPTRAEIGLHWLIGPENTNTWKGGRR